MKVFIWHMLLLIVILEVTFHSLDTFQMYPCHHTETIDTYHTVLLIIYSCSQLYFILCSDHVCLFIQHHKQV